jgi:hypothetical protein
VIICFIVIFYVASLAKTHPLYGYRSSTPGLKVVITGIILYFTESWRGMDRESGERAEPRPQATTSSHQGSAASSAATSPRYITLPCIRGRQFASPADPNPDAHLIGTNAVTFGAVSRVF